MSVTKVNKQDLQSAADKYKNLSSSLSSDVSGVNGVLGSIPSHKDFGELVSAANLIKDSLSALDEDSKNLSTSISNYISTLKLMDSEEVSTVEVQQAEVKTLTANNSSNSSMNTSNYYSGSYSYSGNNASYTAFSTSSGATAASFTPLVSIKPINTNVPVGGNYNYEGIEKYLETLDGETVYIPSGLGGQYTYMGWQCITSRSSNQYKLREAAGMNFDEEGFGKIGDRYVVAVTTTFGQVGDYIDVYLEDGTVIPCVIGDIKGSGDPGVNEWGHNNGNNVIEFIVDQDSWYGKKENPGTANNHPEWNQHVVKVVNKENFFNLINMDCAKVDSSSSSDDSNKDDAEVVML